MTNRAELTRRFCERWLQKATVYDTAQLQDAFDKFFTLFVAFNRLYFHTAQVAGRDGTREDRRNATRFFPKVVGHQRIFQAIMSDDGKDLQIMRQLIGPEGSFFLIAADRDTPHSVQNDDLYRRLGNDSPCIVVEALLEYIYQVRCNMFHGEKSFEDQQLILLLPCLRSLERVIRAGFDFLAEDDGA
jgi:hypothetical protein